MEGDKEVEEGATGIVCTKKYDETESCGIAAHIYWARQLMPARLMKWREEARVR